MHMSSSPTATAATFAQVDQSGAANFLIDFLDRTAEAHFAHINQRSFDLLQLRPGAKVLDAGCGTGDSARQIRSLLGEQGSVVGVDASQNMIDLARERDDSSQYRSTFEVADIQHLPCETSSFDACRVSRVLLHVADPEAALQELVRVVRENAPIVAIEPDFETLIMAHPDRETTRIVRNCFCDSFAHGTIGRWLPVLFRRLGLANVRCEPYTIPVTAEFLFDSFRIGDAAQKAVEKQLISPAQSDNFIEKLHQAKEQDDFFAAATVFLVSGQKQ